MRIHLLTSGLKANYLALNPILKLVTQTRVKKKSWATDGKLAQKHCKGSHKAPRYVPALSLPL